ERGRPEVRVFGTEAAAQGAVDIIERLDMQCKSVSVPVDAGVWLSLTQERLDSLAQTLGVTLRIEGKEVLIHGLSEVVSSAEAELKHFVAQPDEYTVADLQAASNAQTEQVLNSLMPPPPGFRGRNGGHEAGDWKEPGHTPAVAARKMGQMQEDIWHAEHHPMGMGDPCGSHACHHCGAPRYCTTCGNETWSLGVHDSTGCQGYAASVSASHPFAGQFFHSPVELTERINRINL
ncbi:Egln1, partial [Symbiodinium sp. KB8]